MTSISILRPVQGLFACLLLVAFLSACSRETPQAEPVRAVKLIEVGQAPLQAQVEYAGEVRARTESALGFQVAGKLLRRYVNVGDRVKKGQLLAELEAQDYALAAQAAQAQLAAAKTQRDLAQADWQRFSALKDHGFISGVELDRRRASLQSAQAQLEQAQAQAAAQANQSAYTRLLAVADGVITSVQAQPGQVVAVGMPVVQLAHDGARDVVVAVPEGAQQNLRIGQQVQVRTWAQAQTWDAVVREIAASADPVTRTYTVKVAVQAAVQPALGETATVQVQQLPANAASAAQGSDGVITLPSTAVAEQGGKSVVWVFDPATSAVHAQVVQVAGVDGNALVISAGLKPGAQVVATGTHVLSEGQVVSVYQPRHPEAAH